MSEEEKTSAKVFQFPKWASQDRVKSSITRKIYSIRDFAKRVSEEKGGSPGPAFWSTVREKIDKLRDE